jgi:hypothetical protein
VVKESTMPSEKYGQIAYEAYCTQTEGRSLVSGLELPAWRDLNDEFQTAWIVAAMAARSAG